MTKPIEPAPEWWFEGYPLTPREHMELRWQAWCEYADEHGYNRHTTPRNRPELRTNLLGTSDLSPNEFDVSKSIEGERP